MGVAERVAQECGIPAPWPVEPGRLADTFNQFNELQSRPSQYGIAKRAILR